MPRPNLSLAEICEKMLTWDDRDRIAVLTLFLAVCASDQNLWFKFQEQYLALKENPEDLAERYKSTVKNAYTFLETYERN